ncbi:hypothetical protein ER308_04590 [Egibacter rhizosphaerae]|uniref:Tyr recombinase domain-containing protein n=1 Tax=Egibacter rhizosphaerae TaxID=1670831 RepID=A0A411YCF0_9ACTN|nr:tyrosine-type recombinase/integrase [Egibacter rhizosphaerae]QBI18894.1 hypothetical protein ER308_04590 [Egibacter rhizosphaerae]
MGRQRTGQIRQRGNSWVGAVPCGPSGRERSASFSREEDCRRWVQASLEALDASRAVPDPELFRHPSSPVVSQGGASDGEDTTTDPLFATLAREWWTEYYEELEHGGPGRAQDVLLSLENHLVPFFASWRASDFEVGPGSQARAHCKQLLKQLAGRTPERPTSTSPSPDPAEADAGSAEQGAVVTVERAIELTGTSRSTVMRARRAGRLPNADVEPGPKGRLMIPVDDLAQAGLLAGQKPHKALQQPTSAAVLWVLQRVLAFMRSNGYLRSDPTEGLKPMAPRDAAARTRSSSPKAKPLTLWQCRRIAAHLHPVYQLVFWLQRLLGLRVSEAFGFFVRDVVDGGADGIVAAGAQGGRPFLVRDEHGDVVAVRHKKDAKNETSNRLLAVPTTLMRLIRLVIEAYHMDPATGEIAYDAPLIPGMKDYWKPDQQGYRTALRNAGAAEGLSDLDGDDVRVRPHTLRKSFVTQLHGSELDDLLVRRLAGHSAGTDVHERVYVLSDPSLEPLRRAAAELDDAVVQEVGSVLVPTTKRPQFDHSNPLAGQREYSEVVLARAYADEGEDDPLCGTERVAEELDLAPTTARRWMREGRVPTVEEPGRFGQTERFARLSEVRRVREQLHRARTLNDLADEVGRTYHQLYQMAQRLKLDLPRSGQRLVLDEESEAILRRELDRVAELHRRAMSAEQARRELGCVLSTVYLRVRRGELVVDPETDSSGAKFITRASVAAYLERESAPTAKANSVPLPEAVRLSGWSKTELLRLMYAGHLEAVRVGRRLQLSVDSLERWLNEDPSEATGGKARAAPR